VGWPQFDNSKKQKVSCAHCGASSMSASAVALVVFDLDACCWYPEMYQLWVRGQIANPGLRTHVHGSRYKGATPCHSVPLRATPCHQGGGAPFSQEATTPNNTLHDAAGRSVRLLADVALCWADCHERQERGEVLVCVASRCDEPTWGRECLQKFVIKPGLTMMDVVTEERCEIYGGSKKGHLRALHKKTGAMEAALASNGRAGHLPAAGADVMNMHLSLN
jgi:hypothetical protein